MTRHSTLCCLLAGLTLLGCSERPTTPPDVLATDVNLRAASADERKSDLELTSIIWERRAGDYVKARALPPIVAARVYGLVGITQYAAAVAIDGERHGDLDEHSSSGGGLGKQYVRRGALSAAAAQVLTYLFPLDAAAIAAQLAADGATGTERQRRDFAEGVTIGRAIGDVMVIRGRADGFAQANGSPWVWDPTTLPAGPGIWYMDDDATPHVPAGFQFPRMRPYLLNSADQFRSSRPPSDLTAATAEVVQIVADRTTAQGDIAVFWNLANGTVTALGYWDQQAAIYIKEHQMSERAAAHVFALVNVAAMDATIGCWEAKYHYLVQRPWQVDPVGLPRARLIIGRPNHPSYPSGHSCVSSAAGRVLKFFFPEKSATLDLQVAEAGMSRIYAGIHYRFDIEAGYALGTGVAEWAIRYDKKHGMLAAVLLGKHDR